MKMGTFFRLKSFWIGFHYSDFNKRLCINLLPCWTIWITFKGGKEPNLKSM